MKMRGFTLVELILVIVMIGILSAVVGPRFFARQAFEGRLFFEETLAAVRYAQKLALASGCRVQVSLGAGGYSLLRDTNCGTGAAPAFTAQVQGPDGTPYANPEVPNGVLLAPNNFSVAFDSLGRPVGGATSVTIDGFTLNVTAETGLVQ